MPGDRDDARERALQLSLFRRPDAARHQALRRRSVQAPERHDENAAREARAGRREAVDQERRGAEAQARDERAPLAQTSDGRAHEAALHDRRCDADGAEGQADGEAVPAVPIARVQHEHVLQRLVRHVVQEVHGREAEQLPMRAEQLQRAPRVRARPRERRASLGRERFGQDEQPVHRVRQAERRGDPERQARTAAAQHAAEDRPDDEADAERGAHEAKRSRALVGRRDVRDVRERSGDARGRDAGDQPADEQPAERRRERHEDVIEAEAEVRHQHDRPAAEAVGYRSEDWRREKLNARPHRAEQRQRRRRARGVAAAKRLDEIRQHGDDHAERQHVEHDRDQDERDGGTAGCWWCFRS